MTDPIDQVKRAFESATPAPDAARRAANLERALEVFDQFQELASEERPTRNRPARWANLGRGVERMLATLATRPAITAATVTVALVILVIVPFLRQDSYLPLLGSRPDASRSVELQQESQAPPEADAVTEAEWNDMESPIATESSIIAASPVVQPPMAAQAPHLARRLEEGKRLSRSTFAADEAATLDSFGSPAMERWSHPSLALDSRDFDGTETFANLDPDPVKVTLEEPVSTFSIDVDTASYAVVRSSLMNGFLPPADAVRIEEMINYFPYGYPAPEADEAPFRPSVTVVPTPWNPDTQLVHLALQGRLPATADRPPLNLVFLIDTSGSMDELNKLPLLVRSLRLLVGQLRPEDEIAIVAHAGSAGVVLDATTASDLSTIHSALDRLHSGGSTAGAEGLLLAYRVAGEMASDGEVTRVILATDGDFNVGISDPDQLKDLIAGRRDDGVYLSVLGFGRGNLDDATMQSLAQNGNGQAAYIDTLSEARKVLVDQLTGALFPIANDVKIQVEFNPATVAEYRLIGYETRALRREDFNNDRVDAGEIGAGHSVTAIYEITPVDSPAILNSPLRYAASPETRPGTDGELAFLRIRYKEPGHDASKLLELAINPGMGTGNRDTLFAAAIAGFGQILRGSTYLDDWSYADAIALAQANRGDDPFAYRSEAVSLMRLAESLSE